MPKFIDLTDRKFGRLIVIKRVDNNKWGNLCWLCKCDCGNEKVIVGNSLRGGLSKSCGCLNQETRIKHGCCPRGKSIGIYEVWRGMKQRCINPNNERYKDYGGRGITFCNRWENFENFLKDMGERPTTRHSIDRINNDKGYYKGNCRWATSKEQNRNSRSNRMETYNGKTQCLMDWSEETGISYKTIWWRLDHGWSIKKALTIPAKEYKKRKHNG